MSHFYKSVTIEESESEYAFSDSEESELDFTDNDVPGKSQS